MQYRRLGRSGLQVSVLSFGSWVTFNTQLKDHDALECMQAAYDAGCNFFDNAEAYAGGESEAIMGRVAEELGWKRHSYVLTTKVFWGIDGPMVNMQNTLNRKYLMHSINGSLERLRTDFVDILYCHRPDPNTPIEETVWAMSDIISSGKALYWGTSEWAADEIRAAWEIADRHHVAMAREAEMRSAGAMSGEEIVDVRRAGLRKRHPLAAKAQRLERRLEDTEDALVARRDRRAPDQRLGEGDRIDRGHPRSNSLIEVLARVFSSTRLTITAQ
jgi:aryl-alcohol dehydrogenase-like predicted oxidoreductase